MVGALVRASGAWLVAAQLCACVDLAAVQAEAERGAFTGAQRSGPVTLTPWQQLAGARLVARTDATGVPLPGTGAQPLIRFLRPSAIALVGGELYVVDSGLARVFHVMIATETMNALPDAAAQLGVRVRAGSDRSLYLADPVQRSVLRYAPSGRLLQTLSAPTAILGRPGDLALDERRGLVLVGDVSFNQLVILPLLGGAAYPLLPQGPGPRLSKLEGVASGADGFYASDTLCRCVLLYAPNGSLLGTFGQDTLRLPGAIAVDRDERVFVADRGDNTIKVYGAGRQIAVVSGAQIGAAQIADLSVDAGALAVADGTGAQVLLLRVQAAPPARGQTP
jgi:hypothetical protein